MVLDKGYGAEPIRKMIRDENVLSMIPARNITDTTSRTRGRCGKSMKRHFDESLCHQRNKTDNLFCN